jgi:tungstate transport system substrate-binding protein
LKASKADVVLVHAPEAEQKAVAEGWAAGSTLIGSNQFYVVGPKEDPAGVSLAATAVDAFRRIARAKAKFITRGDNSGTQNKEAALWKQAGIEPAGDWYVASNDFMRATLRRADRERAYFMTDSSTWIVAREELPNLRALLQGDPALVNAYHALHRPEPAAAGESHAARFVRFLRSTEAQRIIGEFGKDRYGAPLYLDAARTRLPLTAAARQSPPENP